MWVTCLCISEWTQYENETNWIYVNDEIQNHLLEMYQDYCTDVCISPFRPNTTRPLSKMYVKQSIKAVDRRGKKQQSEGTSTLSRQQPGTEQEGAKEFNLQDMFYSDGKLCKNIYVTAEAGLGKSTFCKHLVDVWCSAHLKRDTHDLLDDERVMQVFPLLFYITLNDFQLEKQQPKFDQYASLIRQQWELGYSVKDFLKDRNCLIIADALDESPQDLPYRGKQNDSIILITSRPWKLESLRTVIEGKTIDKQFQIMGLQYKSYSELSTNIISVLASESASQHKESKNSAGFIMEVTEKGLEAFLEVPVLLIQMLILWYDGHAIGNSQAEIYTNIVHHQIEVNECKESKSNATTTESVRNNSPLHCSMTDCCCRNYNELLFKVAKLAYETLKDGVMVFNHKQTNFYGLSEENVLLCLKMGLLTQEKLFGKFSVLEKEVRFVHKSHHEYFASIHLSTFDQLSQLPTDVNSVITNLDEALKLDKVLMFVAGMNPKMATELAAFILEKCSGDSRIQEYRRTTDSDHDGLVKQVQNLILAAEEESRKDPNMLKPKFRLDDIYVDVDNESRVLSSLPCLEISHLASIRMWVYDQVEAVMPHVQNTAGLQKVYLLSCTIGSRETAEKLVPQSLCVLYLCYVILSHEALTTLSHKLETIKLRELVLLSLICGSHGELEDGKCGVTFDLTRQSHLETLVIGYCDMSGWILPTATPQMKRVILSSVTIPGAMLSGFLRGLPQTRVRVILEDVTVHPEEDIRDILQQIRRSRRVEEDRVWGRGEGELYVDMFEFSE